MTSSLTAPKIGSRYQHYKNKKEYRIIAVGNLQVSNEALDGKQVVIYQALYDDPHFGKNHIWVRPASEFFEEVEHQGKNVTRFAYKGE